MKNVRKCFKNTTGSPGPKIETNNTNKNKNYREHRLLKVQKERKPRWHSFHFIENFVSTRLELFFILRINLHIKWQQVHSNKPVSGAGSPSSRPGSVQFNL